MAYFEDSINKVLQEAENASSDKLEIIFIPEKFHIREGSTGKRFIDGKNFIEANIKLPDGRLIETAIGAYWDGKIRFNENVKLSNADQKELREASDKLYDVYKEAMLILKESYEDDFGDYDYDDNDDNWNESESEGEGEYTEPEDGDYIISDSGPSLGQISVSVKDGHWKDGDHAKTFLTRDHAEAAIKKDIEDQKYSPNVWYISDHGNIDLYKMDESRHNHGNNNKKLDETINISCKNDFINYIGNIHSFHASLNRPLSGKIYEKVMAGKITPAEASILYEEEMEMPEHLSEQVGVLLTKLKENNGKLEGISFSHETGTFPITEPTSEALQSGAEDVNHIQKNGAEAPKEDSFHGKSLYDRTGRWQLSRKGRLESDLV